MFYRLLGFVLVAGTALPVPSFALQGACGQPLSTVDEPTATDALFVLQTSVGLRSCEACVCDWDASTITTAVDALGVLQAANGTGTQPGCPPCDPDSQCPAIAQFVLFSGTRGLCASNADCGGIGTCNTDIGRCLTASQLDAGWTGLAHNGEVNDVVASRLRLACDGEEVPCGECQLVGLDPSLGNCRCANDNRAVCFQPFQPDEQACGGEICQCWFGPPTAALSGNTPTCSATRVASISGPANVDQGAGVIELGLVSRVALGISLTAPCPFCADDEQPADGMRDGVCVGGLNDGMDCDAQTLNTTFPAPGGGIVSIDCFPDPAAIVTPGGLRTQVNISTGVTELASNVRCSENPIITEAMCPCRVCSGDLTLACNSDRQCADAGAGTCTSNGIGAGAQPFPNQCFDLTCEEVGGGEGQCMGEVGRTFCDGIVRANQRGLISCQTNADCEEGTIGVDAGQCTIVEPRSCFPDPMVANGFAHPLVPVGAAAFCTPPTGSASINSVAGFPGPSRLVYQTLLSLPCKSDPMTNYMPGVGGCP